MNGDGSPLPIDHAADSLLQANPVLGAVVIFCAAGLVAEGWFIVRLVRMVVDANKATIDAKDKYEVDLRIFTEAMRDMKELFARRAR